MRITISILIILLSYAGAQARAERVATSKELTELEIVLEHDTIKVGENIRAEIVLKNANDNPLWVNTRLLLNDKSAHPQFREIVLTVNDPPGRESAFQAKIDAAAATAADYRILQPGESVQSQILLNDYFKFDQAGVYKISAVYQDGNIAPMRPTNLEWLNWQIKSPEVELSVNN